MKVVKTEAELRELVMSEVRKHPACGAIRDVAITAQQESGNWGFQFVRDAGAVSTTQCYALIRRQVRDLQEKYARG